MSSLADSRHVVLIGLMGAGKSTVGPVLAEQMGRVFLDLDKMIEDSAGRTITEMFQTKGEAAFRDLEHQALVDVLAARRPLVVAVGGGCAVQPRNHPVLAEQAAVVWLQVEPEVAAQRVGHDLSRPLLAGDPVGSLRRLAAERVAVYRQVADVRIDADGEVDEVAAKVVRKLRQAAADLHWAAGAGTRSDDATGQTQGAARPAEGDETAGADDGNAEVGNSKNEPATP